MRKKGRRPLFVPRISTALDAAPMDELERQFGDARNTLSRFRVITDFHAFCRMNGFDFTTGIRRWIGAMLKDGVSIGTVDTYYKYVQKVAFPACSLVERLEMKCLARIISRAHASSESRGARPARMDEVKRVMEYANDKCSRSFRQALYLIIFTGMRLQDILRLTPQQYVAADDALKVEVRLAKNRGTRAKRRILRVLNVSELIGLPIPPELMALGEEKQDCDSLIEGWYATKMNKELKHIADQTDITEPITTYSFRKFFVGRVITHFKYDWAKVIDFTLHCGIDVVASHYDNLGN